MEQNLASIGRRATRLASLVLEKHALHCGFYSQVMQPNLNARPEKH